MGKDKGKQNRATSKRLAVHLVGVETGFGHSITKHVLGHLEMLGHLSFFGVFFPNFFNELVIQAKPFGKGLAYRSNGRILA